MTADKTGAETTVRDNPAERRYDIHVDAPGGEALAGFAEYRDRVSGTDASTTERVFFHTEVDPAFQRRGLGRELLEHLIRELETRDVFTLWLEVRASNVAAIALYESLGFNEATIRRNYYPTVDGREDAIIMALPISM